MGPELVEYLKYEGDEEELAGIIVDMDTIETMNALGPLQLHARFDHPDKLDKAKKLLADVTDVKSITG